MKKENIKNSQMDMQTMMEVYAKLAIPGPPHKLLAGMEGVWQTKTKCWTETGKPPMESKGTCEQKMLLGGRFLQQVFTGEMMGKPFTGIGISTDMRENRFNSVGAVHCGSENEES